MPTEPDDTFTSTVAFWGRRRRVTKIEWCLLHESIRLPAFPEFCAHGYALWWYSETKERVSRCRFTKARLEVLE